MHPRVLFPVVILACLGPMGSRSLADDITHRLEASLVRPDAAAVEAARQETLRTLDSVRNVLDSRAIGAVLGEDLGIGTLSAELARPDLDVGALDACERRLKRVVVGGVRAPLAGLRESLERLTRSFRLRTGDPEPAREALRLLSAPASLPDDGPDDERRHAFKTLVASSPARSDLAALRRRLSAPNASTTVGTSFVEAVSRKHFEQPVEFRQTRDGARISGRGAVGVALHATAPPGDGVNRLILHADGQGSIAVSADRRRVHVKATARPSLVGAIDLALHADRIDGGAPDVAADFHTRLTSLGIDGLVGRCRIVQRLAAEAIGRALEAGDRTVARKIEADVAARVDEEAHALAHRVNGLLHQGLWDRLASLDEAPEVRTWNDSAGLHAATYYGHDDRLGALVPPPPIPGAGSLDIVSRLHESAINNTLGDLGGLLLDENTARGVWEVQLKLTSDDWSRLPPGRVPAQLRLASRDPAVVRVREGRIDVVLRGLATADAGPAADGSAKDVRFHYALVRGAGGLGFRRSPFTIDGGAAADAVASLQRTLGLFFPESLEPVHRYRPSGFSETVRVVHLDLSAGWLTVGAKRTETEGQTERTSRHDEARQ